MNYLKNVKLLYWLALGITTTLFLVVKVQEYDVWLHLASGKYIWENLKVPHFDPFSFTASNRLYIDSHWLYQVILYGLFNSMGYYGLFLYQFIAIGTIYLVLYFEGKKSSIYITGACVFLSLIVANQRFWYRPEMFSYLFAVLFIIVIEKYLKGGNPKLLFSLPGIQLLWANTHGFFIFGLIIIACYCVGVFLQQKQFLKNLLFIFVACMAACFVNPYGYRLAAYPFLLITEIGSKAAPYMQNVPELLPTFSVERGNYYTTAYIILIVFSAISFVSLKAINFSRIFIFVLFLLVSIKTERNTVFFAFVGSILTVLNSREPKKVKFYVFEKASNFMKIAFMCIVIAACLLVSYGIITNKYFRHEKTIMQRFGIGKVDILFPEGAIKYIKNANISGNVFNDALIGGYFIWNCYPQRKVFIDGKMEIYGDELLQEYKNAIDNPDIYWISVTDKHKINYVLLAPLSPHSGKLITHLHKNKLWEQVYFDESGIVYVKKGSGLNPVFLELSADTRKFTLDKALEILAYANYFYYTGNYIKAKSLYMEAVGLDSGLIEAYINLAAVFFAEGDYENAEKYYTAAATKSSKYAEPHYGIALLNMRKGKNLAAYESVRRAISIKPNFQEAQLLLAYIYQKTGNSDSALKICREMLKKWPADEKIYNLLGSVYFSKQQYENALAEFEKAIKINPRYEEAVKNYNVCMDVVKGKTK